MNNDFELDIVDGLFNGQYYEDDGIIYDGKGKAIAENRPDGYVPFSPEVTFVAPNEDELSLYQKVLQRADKIRSVVGTNPGEDETADTLIHNFARGALDGMYPNTYQGHNFDMYKVPNSDAGFQVEEGKPTIMANSVEGYPNALGVKEIPSYEYLSMPDEIVKERSKPSAYVDKKVLNPQMLEGFDSWDLSKFADKAAMIDFQSNAVDQYGNSVFGVGHTTPAEVQKRITERANNVENDSEFRKLPKENVQAYVNDMNDTDWNRFYFQSPLNGAGNFMYALKENPQLAQSLAYWYNNEGAPKSITEAIMRGLNVLPADNLGTDSAVPDGGFQGLTGKVNVPAFNPEAESDWRKMYLESNPADPYPFDFRTTVEDTLNENGFNYHGQGYWDKDNGDHARAYSDSLLLNGKVWDYRDLAKLDSNALKGFLTSPSAKFGKWLPESDGQTAFFPTWDMINADNAAQADYLMDEITEGDYLDDGLIDRVVERLEKKYGDKFDKAKNMQEYLAIQDAYKAEYEAEVEKIRASSARYNAGKLLNEKGQNAFSLDKRRLGGVGKSTAGWGALKQATSGVKGLNTVVRKSRKK